MKTNLLMYGNCQLEAMLKFLRLHPDFDRMFNVRTAMTYLIDMGLLPQDEVREMWAEADLVIHQFVKPGALSSTDGYMPALGDGVPMHALPVVYNSGHFFCDWNWDEGLGARVRGVIADMGLDRAVEHYWHEGDLDWAERTAFCMSRMKDKEESEGVAAELRLSGLMETKWNHHKMLLTPNHPTTIPLGVLSAKVAEHVLGLPRHPALDTAFLNSDENWAQLPCVDYVCPAAARSLGLGYHDDLTPDAMNHCRGILAKYAS